MSVNGLPTGYDPNSFIRYYNSIGGDLTQTDFYKSLIGGNDPDKIKIVHDILGVNTDLGIRIDPPTFYNNWGKYENALDYASRIGTIYFLGEPVNFAPARGNLQLLSSFLLNWYFATKPSPTQFKPEIVPYKRQGYYIQTQNLQKFFADARTRGIGNLFVNSICTSILNSFDDVEDKRTYVSVNPDLLGWCGCFSPNDPAMENLPASDGGGENFPKACDPLCYNQKSIKLFDINGAEQVQCRSAVCVLSNISLNVEGSTNQRFNFEQICTACDPNSPFYSDEPCRCIVDSDFISLLSKIGATDPDGRSSGMDVQTTFQRYCPNSVCIIIDHITKVPQVLPCNEFNAAATGLADTNYGDGTQTYNFKTGISDDFILLICVIMISFIVLILGMLIKREVEIKVNYSK